MKNLLFVPLVLLMNSMFSQQSTIHVIEGNYVQKWDTPEKTDVKVSLLVNHSEDQTKKIICEKTVTHEFDGTRHYYCWDLCFLPTTSTVQTSGVVALPPDSTTNVFAFHLIGPQDTVDYETQSINQLGYIEAEFKFYDQDNPADYTITTIRINITPVGVEVNTSNKGVQMYPNPANDVINLSTESENATHFEIYNQLGVLMDKIQVVNQTNITHSISQYADGVYFVRCIGEDQTISTTRFVKN